MIVIIRRLSLVIYRYFTALVACLFSALVDWYSYVTALVAWIYIYGASRLISNTLSCSLSVYNYRYNFHIFVFCGVGKKSILWLQLQGVIQSIINDTLILILAVHIHIQVWRFIKNKIIQWLKEIILIKIVINILKHKYYIYHCEEC